MLVHNRIPNIKWLGALLLSPGWVASHRKVNLSAMSPVPIYTPGWWSKDSSLRKQLEGGDQILKHRPLNLKSNIPTPLPITSFHSSSHIIFLHRSLHITSPRTPPPNISLHTPPLNICLHTPLPITSFHRSPPHINSFHTSPHITSLESCGGKNYLPFGEGNSLTWKGRWFIEVKKQ